MFRKIYNFILSAFNMSNPDEEPATTEVVSNPNIGTLEFEIIPEQVQEQETIPEIVNELRTVETEDVNPDVMNTEDHIAEYTNVNVFDAVEVKAYLSAQSSNLFALISSDKPLLFSNYLKIIMQASESLANELIEQLKEKLNKQLQEFQVELQNALQNRSSTDELMQGFAEYQTTQKELVREKIEEIQKLPGFEKLEKALFLMRYVHPGLLKQLDEFQKTEKAVFTDFMNIHFADGK